MLLHCVESKFQLRFRIYIYTDEDLCNLQMPSVNKMPCTVAHVLALEACPLHDVLHSPSNIQNIMMPYTTVLF